MTRLTPLPEAAASKSAIHPGRPCTLHTAVRPSRSTLGVAALLASLLVGGCSDSDSPGAESSSGSSLDDGVAVNEQFANVTERDLAPDASDEDVARVVAAFNAFSLDVHRALAAEEPTSNAITSGYSLASALSLTLSGTAGTSRSALASLLQVDDIEATRLDPAINALDLTLESRASNDLALRSANRLFVSDDREFRADFLDNAVANYGAPITAADFRNNGPDVVVAINDWVRQETDGLIDKLLDDIDPGTVLAALNATLFDALWRDPFEKRGQRDFMTLAGESLNHPFFGYTGNFRLLQEAGLTAISLPYSGSEVSMLIALPDDIVVFEQGLTTMEIDRIVSDLQSVNVNLSMPEWQFEQTIDAKALLAPLGLPLEEMDFSAMLAEPPVELAISQVQQKARIEVDENGTRAAAATAVVSGVTSAPAEDPRIVNIDRAFWFAIRDDATGALLFSGRVTDPS